MVSLRIYQDNLCLNWGKILFKIFANSYKTFFTTNIWVSFGKYLLSFSFVRHAPDWVPIASSLYFTLSKKLKSFFLQILMI